VSVIPSGFGEASVEIGISGDAGPAYVVFGYEFPGGGNPQSNANTLAGILGTSPGFRSLTSSANTLRSVTVRENYAGPFLNVAEATINSVGTLVGAPPPAQVAYLLQKSTGLAGRPNRGRMYVPAANEDEIDGGGFLSAPAVADRQASADLFFNALVSASLPLYILHTSAAIAPTEVNSLEVDGKVATQRRRLR